MSFDCTRRQLLIAGAAGAALFAMPRFAWAIDEAHAEVVDLTVGNRTTRLFAWSPVKPKGIVLFSTGHGSWPERYDTLVHDLAAYGWAVAAPVHVDSMHHPDRAKFPMQASFGERMADMGAASAWAIKRWGALPTAAAGHSFGTLVALCQGGALSDIASFRNPAVKAVLGFSTPGKVSGLVQPTAYASLAVPALIVTGTADTVPGFVTDPADHLFVQATAPNATAMVIDSAAHDFVAGGGPLFDPVIRYAGDFLDARVLSDTSAASRVDAFKPPAGVRLLAAKAHS